MTARTIPTLPTWAAGQRVLAANLASMVSYQQFWADPPMFRMYQAVAQSIPNSAFTQLTMDTLDYDTDSGRSGSTPYGYTIPVGMTARWQFTWKGAIASNATGARAVQLYRNGSAVAQDEFISAPPSGAAADWGGSGTIAVNAGDVMSVWIYQGSGGALNTDVFSQSYFEGRLVSLASP